jgi:hypothetical protein
MASIMEDYMFWLREDSWYVVCLGPRCGWVDEARLMLFLDERRLLFTGRRGLWWTICRRDRSLLSFHKGEIVTIISRDASGWWKGKIEGKPSADIMWLISVTDTHTHTPHNTC